MYVNPIEILGLSNAIDTKSIENEIVKKAKRKLFADIDLSDNGEFEYYGLKLTKGNCEKAIEDLTNNDYKEFYLYLANNRPLNEFLANGKESIFNNFKQDSIFKLPEFIKFISPYFAPKFNKVLLTAFENGNSELTKAILNTSALIAQTDINLAFKSVSNSIQNSITKIDELTKAIKNEESDYDESDIKEVIDLVKEHFPVNILNCLPQYFQSQILKIANAINYLSNSIWDAFDTTQVPYSLTEYLLTLNIAGLDRPTFENNFNIIKKKNDERIEQAKNAPSLKKWALILIKLKNINTGIENKTITPKNAYNSTLEFSIEELNGLPSFANEIRHSIAYVLRGISIAIWNVNKDVDTAIKTINKAISINLSERDIVNLNNDLSKLKELKKEKEEFGEPVNSAPNLFTIYGIGTTIYGKTLYFVFFGIPIIPISRYNCVSTYNGYSFYGKLKLLIWQKIWKWVIISFLLFQIIIALVDSNTSNYSPISTESNTSTSDETSITNEQSNNDTKTNENQTPSESLYKGNQLTDGASPLTGCFGRGVYSGNATLTIKNGGNSDAIICLYSIRNDRTIRNTYVQKNSTFTISKIPQGEYKIRVFYGNDWNPELDNSCGLKGNFESGINFSEFDKTQFFEDSENGFTVATITLYNVAGGNASSSSIDQSNFFRK